MAGAGLRNADLSGANMASSDLSEAILDLTNLAGANLAHATIDDDQFSRAFSVDGAILPDDGD